MKSVNVSNIVPDLQKSYGNYVNSFKMFPNIIDGLLPVQKRLLLTLHNSARNEFVKTSSILGRCMEMYHPHSEALGTAEWLVHNQFADAEGQWGIKFSSEPASCAAPRYTKLKANKKIEDISFELVNYVKWEESELQPEPIFIPTMIPFCLMGKYEYVAIGFGFKAEIPVYKEQDLVKRLLYLIGEIKEEVVISPSIDGIKFKRSKKIFKDLLESGNATLEVQGLFDVDEKNHKVHIYGWNPRVSFKSLINKINSFKDYKLLESEDVSYYDLSMSNTDIVFEVSRTRNKKQIYDKLVETISEVMTSNISYHLYATDSRNQLVATSVDTMLLTCWKHYCETFDIYLEKKLEDLNEKLNRIRILSVIKKILLDNIKDYKLFTNYNYAKKLIIEKSKLSDDIVSSILSTKSIKNLIDADTDETEAKNNISNHELLINNKKEYIIKKYKSFGGIC